MLRYLTFFALITLSLSALSQSTDMKTVASLIAKGDCPSIATSMQSHVELNMMGASATYSRSQAEMVLKRFFADDTPLSFTPQHEGRSRGNGAYCVGTLATEKQSYRLTYFLDDTENGELRIKKIRIEQQR